MSDATRRRLYTTLRIESGTHTSDSLAELQVGMSIVDGNDGATRLELTVVDPELKFAATHFVKDGNLLTLTDTAKVTRRFHTIGYGIKQGTGSPEVTLVGIDRGADAMMKQKGASVVKNISPTEWIGRQARAAGLGFTGQPTAKETQIVRDKEESSWDVAQRLAGEKKMWFWTSRHRAWFGKPSWLVRNAPGEPVTLRWPDPRPEDLQLWSGLPDLQAREKKGDPVTSTLEVDPTEFSRLHIGGRVNIVGIPRFEGPYLITSLETGMDLTQPCKVGITTPEDPA